MNANTSSSDLVHLEFSLLKQDTTYYDKMDLFLSANVAAYEASDPFQKRQDALATIVDGLHKRTPSPKSRRAIIAGRSATMPRSSLWRTRFRTGFSREAQSSSCGKIML